MLGVVTGLVAEARLAAPLGRVLAGGGTPEGAALAAERLAAEGATALLSFGLAGGLSPSCGPGTIIIPARVVTARGAYATDKALNRWLGGAEGDLYAAPAIASSHARKRALYARTGAVAVDLESGAVADVARAHALPFAVLRAVCDPVDTDLPPAAMIALDTYGAIGLVRVLGSVARHPAQLASLVRLASHAAIARRGLVRRVKILVHALPD